MSVIAQADCINLPFPSKYFHTIITSPPYLGLRKYEGYQVRSWRAGAYIPMTSADLIKVDEWVGPLGGEPSIELYVFHLLLVCRELRRVLRDDGVFWLVLGDSYNGSGGAGGDYLPGGLREGQPTYPGRSFSTLANGDLIGVPQRVWFALQADGWIVRNEVIWWKRNTMPQPLNGWRYEQGPCDCTTSRREALIASMPDGVPRHRAASEKPGDILPLLDCPKCHGTGRVGDFALRKGSWRHTRSHESVFHLVKKMNYYSNLEAVRVIYTKPLDRWGGPRKSTEEAFKGDEENRMRGLHRDREMRPNVGSNPRSVLDVPTSSYEGAHYAVYPPKLVVPLMLSSCPRRCCPECGAPWAPVVEKHRPMFGKTSWGLGGRRHFKMELGEMLDTDLGEGSTLKYDIPRTVTGYRPTCTCGREDFIPGKVLDPFLGSGTTLEVANELMRNGIGSDISFEYLDQQAKIRAKLGTPSGYLDDLPLFSEG